MDDGCEVNDGRPSSLSSMLGYEIGPRRVRVEYCGTLWLGSVRDRLIPGWKSGCASIMATVDEFIGVNGGIGVLGAIGVIGAWSVAGGDCTNGVRS